MKISKKSLLVCLVIVITAIICLLIVFFTGQKKNEIKLGMTCEEAISILEQGHYQYEIINDDQTTLLVRGVVFCDIKGGAFLTIDSLNNISRIAIGFENGDVDNKAAILYEHLCKLYGDPIEIKENDLSKIFGDKYKYCYFKKNNMEIEFLYPISEDRDMFSIGIHWYYENS